MKVIRYAVTHPVTVWMVTLAAVVFGLTALGRLDMRLLPEIRYPSLTVQTEFPGTAPVDVENLVTRPLEESVGVVPGLRLIDARRTPLAGGDLQRAVAVLVRGFDLRDRQAGVCRLHRRWQPG